MRHFRFLPLLLVMFFAATVFTAAAAADDDDDDDARKGSGTLVDFARGTGTAEFQGGLVPSTFDFDVTSGPAGEAAAGFATLTSAIGETFSGPATCLRVSGNLAVFEVDNQNPANAARDVVVFVGDFGALGVPERDSFNFDLIGGVADANCPDVQERERSVVAGDIEVADNAQPRRGGGDDDDDDEGDEDDDG
jgi:hypothetical protein